MKDSYKYFKFELSKFIGYKLVLEKSNLKHYCKLKYNGFEIVYTCDDSFKFKIENQLLRILKLKHLNNELKPKSIEYLILELISKSVETTGDFYESFTMNYWYSYSDEECISEIKHTEFKNRNKYDNRRFNQKLKSYESKGRFRK